MMETDDVLDLLKQAADEHIVPRFRRLNADEVSDKGQNDLVTVADRESEIFISAALRLHYPDAMILGEEATAADYSAILKFRAASHAFTVDPVDGTHNFVQGSPDYAVMVAELRFGRVVRSWILQPERHVAFVAEQGSGAWRNGQRLPALRPSSDSTDWQGAAMQPAIRTARFGGLRPVGVTRSCAGIDYSAVAEGTSEFVVFSNGMPWDHAPGALLVAEVGGAIISNDGMPYEPQRPCRWLVGAASSRIASQIHRAVAVVVE